MNKNFINKTVISIMILCGITMLAGCANKTEVVETPVPEGISMDGYTLESTDFPDELKISYENGKPAFIYSQTPGVNFADVKIGDTYKTMVDKIGEKYEPFYSVHDPENANIGWYMLNDTYDVVIFDFDLEDGSYVNEPVSDNATIKAITITNLKYFD